MAGVNKAIIVGRLGKDPETKVLTGGVTLTTFSVATSEKYKDAKSGEPKEITDWHNVVSYRGLADIAAKFLHKGSMVYIEGKLRTSSYQKNDSTHYSTKIIADTLQLLDSKPKGASETSSTPPQSHPEPMAGQDSVPSNSSDDLPF